MDHAKTVLYVCGFAFELIILSNKRIVPKLIAKFQIVHTQPKSTSGNILIFCNNFKSISKEVFSFTVEP